MNRTSWPVLKRVPQPIFTVLLLLSVFLISSNVNAKQNQTLPYRFIIQGHSPKIKTGTPCTFTVTAVDRHHASKTANVDMELDFTISSREFTTTERIQMKKGKAEISKTIQKAGYYIATINHTDNPNAQEYMASSFVTVLP